MDLDDRRHRHPLTTFGWDRSAWWHIVFTAMDASTTTNDGNDGCVVTSGTPVLEEDGGKRVKVAFESEGDGIVDAKAEIAAIVRQERLDGLEMAVCGSTFERIVVKRCGVDTGVG